MPARFTPYRDSASDMGANLATNFIICNSLIQNALKNSSNLFVCKVRHRDRIHRS